MLIQKAQPASVKLIPSDNGTRYKCVYDAPGKDPTRRYVVKVSRKGVMTIIDRFATLEDAAICYALTPEGREDAAKLAKAEALRQEQDMTSAQAIATAVEERLELQTNGSGFVGVFQSPQGCKLPFMTRINLGCFATEEEAALCRARELAAQAVAPAAAADELALTCPICIEPIKADSAPVATACLHVFCRCCIEDWIEQSQPEATCPMCREPLNGASGSLTAVPLAAAADASTAPRRTGWNPREWQQMLVEQASVEAELAARAEATARSDEQQAAFVYHSGVPRPVDLARAGYRPLFSQRRGGHMSRGEAHPRASSWRM
ncbi:hypothetical protein EMIHUDRAFT_201720 [Emiliania huxleyi CCMP1516]|uniref:RING-type domain-containing protein n=2 Tax=Emiliania huxleyi TaxID=2903 RepID=A0A0D3KIH2_EMIH1|nr:hypothetical protein EMIHUDRAFT_201720 [Emiliania huxleyi CCMP1516]EOD35557.1 hypothetical protein EMIHUDRAFT_201720 [Emiliania huxleyi CCMP1516]|eukprot:XP_005787986.1 hypothetical protein EMIHUDRAFT_201720 [Emiliania huxleyi CCMP1516]